MLLLQARHFPPTNNHSLHLQLQGLDKRDEENMQIKVAHNRDECRIMDRADFHAI